jgi:alkanesulfonate monooxygenase SsuD/methylene tetrahydromethanopterin reductase-like flavin-dependent oxidoreductase (luciferase family)
MKSDSSKKIGLGLGYDAQLTVSDMIPWVKEAEKRGFDLAFFSETIMTLRDAISCLSAFALSTNEIKLGCTQIVRTRTPLVMAQTFATLDELSNKRIFVSLGACTKSHCKKNGLEYVDAAESLKEYIIVIKKLLTGGEVTYNGSTIKIENSKISFKPPRPDLPLYVAATSRKGLEIAGMYGDGVLLNATTSVEYCKNAIRIVRESAEKAGRNPDNLFIAGIIVASVAENSLEAVEHARKEVATKLEPLQVDFAIRPRLKVGEPYITEELIDRLLKSYSIGGFEKLMKDIPEEVVRGFTACGTAEEVRERIEEYRKVGVQLPIVRPADKFVFKSTFNAVAPS